MSTNRNLKPVPMLEDDPFPTHPSPYNPPLGGVDMRDIHRTRQMFQEELAPVRDVQAHHGATLVRLEASVHEVRVLLEAIVKKLGIE